MRLKLLPVLFVALGLALSAAAPGEAPAPAGPISIDIDQGAVRPMPIAIPAFEGELGAQIAQVVADDLERSGLFAPIPQAQFIERNLSTDTIPSFPDWRSIGAQALVNGRVRPGAGGQLEVDFRLWDIPSASDQQMLGTRFISTPANIRRIGHKIADAIYQRLTGEEGYFDTRIVFVSESGPRNARVKRLMIMDQDGFGPSVIGAGGDYIALTPRFSSSSQEITFMALSSTEAAVYLFNLDTGRRERLGSFPGATFAPRFSPDGGRVAFSLDSNGNSDIHVMTLNNRATTRLTTDPGIDTSPSFSPDGARITFTSDRAGRPQIYVMNANGSGVRRISSGGGSYSTPVWSPKGDFIAFTKQVGGQFHIGVMKPDGSDERLLTTSYLDEGPSWAPNGRVLIFFRETPGGDPKLWTVDVTGRILRPAPYAGAGSDPAWSPRLN